MSDRHYKPGETVPTYARKCDYCKRPIRGRFGRCFGSNACRQAAYRARQKQVAQLPAVAVENGAAPALQEARLRRQNNRGWVKRSNTAKGGRS